MRRRVLAGLCALPLLWVYADLYLRVPLPGAATLENGLFALAAAAARTLDGDYAWLKPLVAVLAVLAVALGRRSRLAPVVVLGPVAGLAVAGLMERGALVGLLVAGAAGFALGGRGGGLVRRRLAPDGVGAWVLGASASVACVAWLVLLLQAQPSYPVLADLGAWFRLDGGDPRVPLAALQVGVIAGALLLLGVSSRYLPGAALLGALAAMAASGAAGEEQSPLWFIAPMGVAALGGAWLAEPLGVLPRRPWGTTALVLSALVGCLLGQTYALRVLRCPAPGSGAERIATTSQLFRVELTKDGSAALLANRFEGTLQRIALDPPGPIEPVHPGGIPGAPVDAEPPGRLPGFPEELVRLPDGSFVSTLVTLYGYTNPEIPPAGGCPDPADFGSLLVHIDADGRHVKQAMTLPDSCWIGAVGWDPIGGQLLMGWEYEAGLHVLDPRDWTSRAVRYERGEHGDFGEVEVTSDGRVFMTSLWGGSRLAELDRGSLRPTRSLTLAGANYDLVVDEERGRAFVVGFYTSRVYVVDLARWEVIATLPTGLGTRSLAIDSSRDLLLVSSIYDGTIRAIDLETLAPRAAVRVGGHVKDIAVDPARGLAYGWSQCGLVRLDLARLGAPPG